jgi:DNA-binding YbaB/EbfC family protein
MPYFRSDLFMFENLTNFSKLIRGAGQMMPRIQKMKENLGKKEVEATSTIGHVTVCMSGAGSVTRVDIDFDLLQRDDKSSIETQMVEAMNLAIQQAKSLHLKAVREVVDELGIPGIDRVLEQLAE